MKKSTKNSLLIGASVIIDYPIRWQGPDPERSKQMRAECVEKALAHDHDARLWHWGETGVIIAYNPGADSGNEYEVLLDKTSEIQSFHYGAMTVQSLPPDAYGDPEIVAGLGKIITAIQHLEQAVVKAIKDAEPAL